MGTDSNTGKLAVVAIVLFALWIRLIFFVMPINITYDARDRYVPQAENLLAGNGFSKSTTPPYPPQVIEHNPGYAFFLAGIFLITKNIRFLTFIQIILEMLTIYLIWLTSSLLDLSQRTRRLVIITALLCPLIARFTSEVLTEVLATFSIALALYLLVLCIKKERLVYWIIAGLAFGLVWFVRMDQIIILALFTVCSIVLTRQIKKTAILLLIFASAASPWIYRNYKISGQLKPVSNLYRMQSIAYVRWGDSWITSMKEHKRYVHDQKPNPNLNYRHLAQQQIKKSKIRAFVIVPALRLINVLKDDLLPRKHMGRKGILLIAIAYITVILGILGTAIAIYRREWILLLPLSVIVGRWILPMMSSWAMHFRLLLESVPALYLFAGIAANAIYENVNKLFFEIRARKSPAQEKPIFSETSDV